MMLGLPFKTSLIFPVLTISGAVSNLVKSNELLLSFTA